MKKNLALIIGLSAIVISQSDVLGGIGATIIDYIPIPGTSIIALNKVYKEAMDKIYELRDQEISAWYDRKDHKLTGDAKYKKYSTAEKKYAVDNIIKLSYDMIDIFTSVTERFSDRVKALREHTKEEADKMNALKPDAIKNNNFIAISNIAENLIDYLASKASQTSSAWNNEMRADLDDRMKKKKAASRQALESKK